MRYNNSNCPALSFLTYVKYLALDEEDQHADGKPGRVADEHQVEVLQLQRPERLLLHGLEGPVDVVCRLEEARLLHLVVLGGKDLLVGVRLEHPEPVPEQQLAHGELVRAGRPVFYLVDVLLPVHVGLVADDAVVLLGQCDKVRHCKEGKRL